MVYAHTLCGHEYAATDDYERSLTSFRAAVRLDPRHYNAWYGLGLVFWRQERFELAEYHFRRALTINPHSSVLCCYLGMTLLATHRPTDALPMLDRAVDIDPFNTLARFKRAAALHAAERSTEALAELAALTQLAPKEPTVHFLAGKIHKKLGHTEAAVLCFTAAMDLDHKNANFIKGLIDKIGQPDNDDADLSRLYAKRQQVDYIPCLLVQYALKQLWLPCLVLTCCCSSVDNRSVQSTKPLFVKINRYICTSSKCVVIGWR